MVQKKPTEREPSRSGAAGRAPTIRMTALARAADTFWKAGYAGTSLDDLVAATGMNRPSLYAAFGDKRDLYLKTLEYYRRRGPCARTARRSSGDPPLPVFLKRFYGQALDLYLADGSRGCYSIGTAATVAVVDDDVRAFLAESMRSTDSFLRGQIDKAKERGEIPRDTDTTALAYLATATLHTLAVRSRAGIPRKQLNALVDAAIRTICPKS